jgi:hypothetical protein
MVEFFKNYLIFIIINLEQEVFTHRGGSEEFSLLGYVAH